MQLQSLKTAIYDDDGHDTGRSKDQVIDYNSRNDDNYNDDDDCCDANAFVWSDYNSNEDDDESDNNDDADDNDGFEVSKDDCDCDVDTAD